MEMDIMTGYLAEARSALARQDWRECYAAYVRADGVGPMAVDDLDAYSSTAWRLRSPRARRPSCGSRGAAWGGTALD